MLDQASATFIVELAASGYEGFAVTGELAGARS
jgi:hypothetical protein